MAAIAEVKTQNTIDSARNSYVIQATSAQDCAWNGVSEDGSFEFIAVSDSHGRMFNKDLLMKYVGDKNWPQFLQQDNWKEVLLNETCDTKTFGVGATFTIVKIFINHFECYWIGDSTAKIYCDDELVFQTKDHCNKNQEEIERLVECKFQIKNGWDIAPKDAHTLLSFKAKIFKKNGEGCNMTRTLGHCGLFNEGLESPISTSTIQRDVEKTYKIIVATDGLWGMVATDDSDKEFISDSNVTSKELATFASERWNKAWTWDNSLGDIEYDVSLPKSNIDDVGVSVWTDRR